MGCCFSSEEDKDLTPAVSHTNQKVKHSTLTLIIIADSGSMNKTSILGDSYIFAVCNNAAAGERAPLLADSSQSDHIQQIQGSRSSSNYSQQNQKEDEQSEFSRILRQTAINVIDVTSTESQNMEHGEMQDRATQYSNRLNMVLSASGKTRSAKPNLPSGITSPQMVLTAPCVSIDDVLLITSYSEKLAAAAQDIKIQHKESLIVSFGVP